MRIRSSVRAATAAILLTLMASVAAAADPPPAFGTGHDNPRTAYPSPPATDLKPCAVEVIRHSFSVEKPALSSIDAAAQCPGPWHRIVLRLDGAVKGRQYDRIGYFSVGGVAILRSSTPEPSREGIEWRVEKDVTAYAPLFTQAQPVELAMDNFLDEVHDGVIHLSATLLFYPADAQHPPARTADLVLPLPGVESVGVGRVAADAVGRITIPSNSERLVAEVYATGSGGGCEEFWYMAAPLKGFWCPGAQGPYREVELLLDGRVAGIAAPYPYVYTGGWSNPYLWYTIPAPRAFDLPPLRFDITPFIGVLNDGRAHELRVRVKGLDAGQKGWTLLPNVQVWRDAGVVRTRAALLNSDMSTSPPEISLGTVDPDDQSLRLRSAGRFTARGFVQGSHGRIETLVERHIDNDSHHRWTSQEDGDDHLIADWRDLERITRQRGGATETETCEQRYGIEGSISTAGVDGKPRLTTTMRIHDDGERTTARDGKVVSTRRSRDRFAGSATYNAGGEVPRDQRNAVADTRQSYRIEGDGECWQRTLVTRNGRFVRDETGCR